ncbi:MAG: hypothetical protein ABIS16_05900 [Sphingomicrobium sp.]
MPSSGTPSAAYKHFGVKPKNIQWSWSGRSDDKVAVTLWKDKFLERGSAYENWHDDVPGEWRSRPGFVELIENLAHAQDHLDGVVHVIVAVAEDEDARPRSIERSFPTNMRMNVARLDRDNGTFRLELIR